MDSEVHQKKKSDFINSLEEGSLAVMGVILLYSVLVFGGAYFGIIYRAAFLVLILGPPLFILALGCYIVAKFIGWIQEGESEKAISYSTYLIIFIIFLYFSGAISNGVQLVNEFVGLQSKEEVSPGITLLEVAVLPMAFFEHLQEQASSKAPCSSDAIKCNGVCYTKCKSGVSKCLAHGMVCEGIYLDGEYSTYKTENYCNNSYWPDCGQARKFLCDPVKGGMCSFDYTKCNELGKHNCQNACWATCPAGSYFICDDVRGGICKEY